MLLSKHLDIYVAKDGSGKTFKILEGQGAHKKELRGPEISKQGKRMSKLPASSLDADVAVNADDVEELIALTNIHGADISRADDRINRRKTLEILMRLRLGSFAVNLVDKVLPVANEEESHEQETEEDSLSTTSTIEYTYSEEEYPSEDEEDEDDEEDEYDYNEGTGTAIEENEQVTIVSGTRIITAEDIAQIIQKASQTLSEVPMTNSTAVEGKVGMANSTAIERNKHGKVGMTDSPPTIENEEDEARRVSPDGWLHWLNFDERVGSMKELDRVRNWTWINVYAYYNKKQGYGGYGVILRNGFAKPILASAKFFEDGKCFYYQVFMGINAGVQLAEKHNRSDLHVQCNSIKAPAILGDARLCSNNECKGTRDPNKICKQCQSCFSCSEGCNRRLVVPLLLELRGKNLAELSYSWSTNSAEHYLAKREKKNKRSEVTKKGKKTRHVMESRGENNKRREVKNPCDDDAMEASEFPRELRKIVLKEAGMPHFRWIGPPSV